MKTSKSTLGTNPMSTNGEEGTLQKVSPKKLVDTSAIIGEANNDSEVPADSGRPHDDEQLQPQRRHPEKKSGGKRTERRITGMATEELLRLEVARSLLGPWW